MIVRTLKGDRPCCLLVAVAWIIPHPFPFPPLQLSVTHPSRPTVSQQRRHRKQFEPNRILRAARRPAPTPPSTTSALRPADYSRYPSLVSILYHRTHRLRTPPQLTVNLTLRTLLLIDCPYPPACGVGVDRGWS